MSSINLKTVKVEVRAVLLDDISPPKVIKYWDFAVASERAFLSQLNQEKGWTPPKGRARRSLEVDIESNWDKMLAKIKDAIGDEFLPYNKEVTEDENSNL